MPISIKGNMAHIERDAFYDLDHKITGLAFDIQNEYGRLLDEKIYQKEPVVKGKKIRWSLLQH
ncbi:MAG: hypothetical protein AAF492_08385, partial [Verrucomicrobiota bacterium]